VTTVSESNRTTSGGPLGFGFSFQSSSVGTVISALPLLLVLFLPGLAAVTLFVVRRNSANQRARDAHQPARQRQTDRPAAGTEPGGFDTGQEDGTGSSNSLLGGNGSESEAGESLIGGADGQSPGPNHAGPTETGGGPGPSRTDDRSGASDSPD
jgi:hypothetical protein